MKLKTLIQACCSLLAFIMIFLPWYTATLYIYSVSENAFGEPFVGVIVLLAALAAMAWYVVSILKDFGILKFKLAAKTEKIINIVIPSAVVLCGVIGMIVCLAQGQGIAHPGVGTWLYIVLGVAMLVLCFVKLEQTVGKATKK